MEVCLREKAFSIMLYTRLTFGDVKVSKSLKFSCLACLRFLHACCLRASFSLERVLKESK